MSTLITHIQYLQGNKVRKRILLYIFTNEGAMPYKYLRASYDYFYNLKWDSWY